MIHHPVVLDAVFYASLAKMYNKLQTQTNPGHGVVNAIHATASTALDALDEVPFFKALLPLEKAREGKIGQAAGEFVQARTMPGFISDIAKAQDTDANGSKIIRKNDSFGGQFQSAIPDFGLGLPIPSRQELPSKGVRR